MLEVETIFLVSVLDNMNPPVGDKHRLCIDKSLLSATITHKCIYVYVIKICLIFIIETCAFII